MASCMDRDCLYDSKPYWAKCRNCGFLHIDHFHKINKDYKDSLAYKKKRCKSYNEDEKHTTEFIRSRGVTSEFECL